MSNGNCGVTYDYGASYVVELFNADRLMSRIVCQTEKQAKELYNTYRKAFPIGYVVIWYGLNIQENNNAS